MNWLKKLLNQGLDSFKQDVVREIDRAMGKLNSGETVGQVVPELQRAVAGLVAKAKLPPPLGTILVSLLLVVDWSGLLAKPAGDVVAELARLRAKVLGARL